MNQQKNKPMKKTKKMKRLIFAILFILPLVVYGRDFFGLKGANPKIKLKVQLVKQSLVDAGYNPRWFTISEKRNKYFNALLPNSAKKSHHLHGNAIDVYVIDIDGDGVFTQEDLDIVKRHIFPKDYSNLILVNKEFCSIFKTMSHVVYLNK
jgi:hypothetical protein